MSDVDWRALAAQIGADPVGLEHYITEPDSPAPSLAEDEDPFDDGFEVAVSSADLIEAVKAAAELRPAIVTACVEELAKSGLMQPWQGEALMLWAEGLEPGEIARTLAQRRIAWRGEASIHAALWGARGEPGAIALVGYALGLTAEPMKELAKTE